jgi:hypothetical protein
MEKRTNSRIETYTTKFKDDLRSKILDLSFSEPDKINELLGYIYDYDRLEFSKDDFSKRKRVKNIVPAMNRCIAKRANDEQCTRRRNANCEFCGTHSKGIPHGSIYSNAESLETNKSVVVTAEDIRGIIYYIDKFNNVYKTEDIMKGKEDPEIIAKCVKNGNNYTIPEFGVY